MTQLMLPPKHGTGWKTMYDELVKRLRYCSEEHSGCGVCELSDNCVLRARLLLQAADAIEELILTAESYKRSMEAWADVAANAQSNWIPVTERLPKESDGMVFVLLPDEFPYNSKQPFVNCEQDRRIEMAHYSEHSGTWYFGDCGAVGGKDPIAWIPRDTLPEPPKEE